MHKFGVEAKFERKGTACTWALILSPGRSEERVTGRQAHSRSTERTTHVKLQGQIGVTEAGKVQFCTSLVSRPDLKESV